MRFVCRALSLARGRRYDYIESATEETHKFARRLAAAGQDMWVRYVLVPGFNDSDGEVDAFIDTVAGLDAGRVEILPFHKLGEPKYERLGIPFTLTDTPPAAPELVLRVRGRMLAGGLPVAG